MILGLGALLCEPGIELSCDHPGIKYMTQKQVIDSELTKARTELARSRHHREAMAIAERRGELIEKSFVARQAQYIFITLRQAILNFPTRYARHVLGITDEHQAKAVLTKAAHEFLTELASFSEKAIDPGWMQLEADGFEKKGPLRPATGAEIRREAEKAKTRRQRKTATMRQLRAKAKIV